MKTRNCENYGNCGNTIPFFPINRKRCATCTIDYYSNRKRYDERRTR